MEIMNWILLVIAVVVSVFLGYYYSSLKAKATINGLAEREKLLSQQLEENRYNASTDLKKLEEKLNASELEKEKHVAELARQQAENSSLGQRLQEHKSEIEQLNERFKKEFENLAQKILDEKSEKFTHQNKLNIETILNPLKEKIRDFETKVESSHKESIEKHASLKQQIEDLSKLNEKINQEAHNLTRALKGDQKAQGNWGEVILERILEKSGLEKDREYFIQQSFQTEDNRRLQPDVVVSLPENKSIVVDSKVSLIAFEKYFNEEDEAQKSLHLKNHLISVRNHIKQLSEKKYQNIYEIQTLDFVLLFIPVESAFTATVQNDQEIFNYAFERNIVIVSPSTLLATLRTISSIWKFEHQNRNAMEIARQGGALYDKFVGFTEDLISIGKNLDRTKSDYNEAMKKLYDGSGNLVRRVENLKQLGAKTNKAISQQLIERADDEDIH